jgi:exopolysaccharide biosynthesis polyprenyl glycosylphosphotransferase
MVGTGRVLTRGGVGEGMAVLDHRGGAAAAPTGATKTRTSSTRTKDLSVVRPQARWQPRYVARCIAADATAALISGAAAYLLHFGSKVHGDYLAFTGLLPLVWLLAVSLNRAYEPRFLGVGSEEFRRVMRAGIAMIAIVSFSAYATSIQVARHYVLISLPLVTVLTVAERYAIRQWLHRRRANGEYLHRVVVVGHELPVLEMLRRLGDERYHGLQVVAACLPLPGQRPSLMERGVPVVGGFGSVAQAVRLTDADTVAVLASPDLGPEQLRRLAWELEPTGADLMVAPSLVEVAGPRLSIRPVSGLPLLQVEQPQFAGGRRIVKSTFDRTLALGAVAALSPLLIGIALAVRLSSRGPAFFTQQRIGRDGVPFTMIKFRSMVVDAEQQREQLIGNSDRDGLMFKMHADPRITKVGRVLRRFSLDELPQLWNVVKGDMSLVGPRPPLPQEYEAYHDAVHRRLRVRPGLTGLWQVSGRADLTWEESVRMDLRYVDNWSIALDLQILWKTARAVLRGSGAY